MGKSEAQMILWVQFGNAINCLRQELVGKLCTIVDGAILDDRQCKAVKDMVKEASYGAIGDFGKDWERLLYFFAKQEGCGDIFEEEHLKYLARKFAT